MFARSGLIPAPCGVPSNVSRHSRPSNTPARSHRSISRSRRRSATRCATIRSIHSWSTESKKLRMSASSTQFPYCVINAVWSDCKRPVWLASRSEPVREPQKVGLVDGAQHLGHRPLDHLVLERWHPNRALPTTRFRDVHASDRLRPVASAVHPIAQVPQPSPGDSPRSSRPSRHPPREPPSASPAGRRAPAPPRRHDVTAP